MDPYGLVDYQNWFLETTRFEQSGPILGEGGGIEEPFAAKSYYPLYGCILVYKKWRPIDRWNHQKTWHLARWEEQHYLTHWFFLSTFLLGIANRVKWSWGFSTSIFILDFLYLLGNHHVYFPTSKCHLMVVWIWRNKGKMMMGKALMSILPCGPIFS